jgi:CRP-like cAMP-binding protein
LFNLAAYIEESPSRFYIQSLEDSEVLSTSIEDFRKLIREHTVWRNIYVNFLEEYYVVKENREADFLLYTAKSRYSNFRRDHSDLEKRVPQHYIASFLGIAPESLSRIRRTLNKDQCEE